MIVSGEAAHPSWNPWANDRRLLELYRSRCRRETDEMTCAAQAADLLAEVVRPGESVLDAGCGGGYYYWSLQSRGLQAEYFGIDYTPEMITLAREVLCPAASLSSDRFTLGRIENLDRVFDHLICFNVLTNNPHYAVGLERLLACTRRRLVMRESMGDRLEVRFTPDPYLDEDKRHIRVYHNTYPIREIIDFIEANGFKVSIVPDRRTADRPEMVVDIPHYWRVLVADRVA
jgi:SAM-dependent methyltransferase